VALATVSDIEGLGFTRYRFGYSAAETAAWETFAERYIGIASRRLKALVNETIYADAGAGAPAEADRAVDLRQAEAAQACALMAKAWTARHAARLGDTQAAKSRIAVNSDVFAGLRSAIDEMMDLHDLLVEDYAPKSQGMYAIPDDIED
jgi:hypothetical protein